MFSITWCSLRISYVLHMSNLSLQVGNATSIIEQKSHYDSHKDKCYHNTSCHTSVIFCLLFLYILGELQCVTIFAWKQNQSSTHITVSDLLIRQVRFCDSGDLELLYSSAPPTCLLGVKSKNFDIINLMFSTLHAIYGLQKYLIQPLHN